MTAHASTDTQNVRRLHPAWVILAAAFVIRSATSPVAYAIAPPLPNLAREAWSRSAATGGLSTMILTGGVAGPLVGALIDRFGPRRVTGVGAGVLALGLGLTSLARKPRQYVLAYGFLSGLAMAGSRSVPIYTVALATATVPMVGGALCFPAIQAIPKGDEGWSSEMRSSRPHP